jgi:predicted metal-dependent hydrolase
MQGDGVVEVVIPPHLQVPPIEELLQSRQRWIFRQLDRFDALSPVRPDRVDYLGNEYRVLLERHDGRTGWIELREGELRVELPREVDVTPAIQTFLRKQARTVLIDRVRIWSEVMELHPGRISVRDQRTRWGSCSHNGSLNFSWRLVMAPLPVLDYVVIHELMHLCEMNHGKRFWDGVARYSPEYRQHVAWLKNKGAKLARPLMIDDAGAA